MGLIICNRAIPFLKVLIFSCFLSKFSIAIDKITTTKPITDTDSIISSNNAFQLGFFSPINTTHRYVGIWYHNHPSDAVVWVANRDRPLNDSSGTMIVSNDGNLLILNGQKQIIWSSNVSNRVVNSSAQLLDSGNLVIQDDSNGRTIWESFHYLSDSVVPGMKLGSDARLNVTTMLRSWKSSSDPSVGTFSSSINSLTIPEFYIWNGSHPYWRSGPWNGRTYIGVPHLNPRYINWYTLVHDNKGNAYVSFNFENTLAVRFYFVLNPNGIIMGKYMTELKQPEWEVAWSSRESDCDVYGQCGPFGSCNSEDSPICSCLPGFDPNNVEEWNRENFSSGCVRKTPLKKCKTIGSSNPEKEDGFLKLKTMKVPALPNWASVKEIQCQNLCLINCSCTAYAYQQVIGCMWWSGSLIDIQKFSSGGADLFIRVANSKPGNIL